MARRRIGPAAHRGRTGRTCHHHAPGDRARTRLHADDGTTATARRRRSPLPQRLGCFTGGARSTAAATGGREGRDARRRRARAPGAGGWCAAPPRQSLGNRDPARDALANKRRAWLRGGERLLVVHPARQGTQKRRPLDLRLDNVLQGTELDGTLDQGGLAEVRHHDNRCVFRLVGGTEGLQHQDAVLARHHDVEQDHLWLDAGAEVDARYAVVGNLDLVTVAAEERRVVIGGHGIILDDHYGPRARPIAGRGCLRDVVRRPFVGCRRGDHLWPRLRRRIPGPPRIGLGRRSDGLGSRRLFLPWMAGRDWLGFGLWLGLLFWLRGDRRGGGLRFWRRNRFLAKEHVSHRPSRFTLRLGLGLGLGL